MAYRIDPSRSTQAAEKLLGNFRGTVLSDGYQVYTTLSNLQKKLGKEAFAQGFCWSHVRRKFIDAARSYPLHANAIIHLIDCLFLVERDCKTGPPASFDGDKAAWTRHLRQSKSRYILAALEVWRDEKLALPESSLGKAQGYMQNLWPGLVRFLDEPLLPIDNNGTERALRGLVVGRKNHYGSQSERGTEVAAKLYTLFESTKLAEVNPAAYLRCAVTAAIAGEAAAAIKLPREFSGSGVDEVRR